MSVANEFKPDSAIVSHCRGCRFAVLNGPIQEGCQAGRLEILAARPGVKIELCDDPPEIPDPFSFFVIDGAACMYKRRASWVGTPDEAREEIRSRIKIKLFVVAAGPLGNLARTVGSAEGFSSVGVVPGNNPPPRPEVSAWMRENCPVPWTVDWYRGEVLPWTRLVDEALCHCDSVFYVRTHAGVTLPEGLVDRVRSALVDRERAFLALEDFGYEVVQTRAHREVGGNEPTKTADGGEEISGVLNKLRHVAKDKGEVYVLPAGEVL